MVRYTRTNKNKKKKISTAKKVGGATRQISTSGNEQSKRRRLVQEEETEQIIATEAAAAARVAEEETESCHLDSKKCIICDKDVKFELVRGDEGRFEKGYMQCNLTDKDGKLVEHARDVLLCKTCAIHHYNRMRKQPSIDQPPFWECYLCRRQHYEDSDIIQTIKGLITPEPAGQRSLEELFRNYETISLKTHGIDGHMNPPIFNPGNYHSAYVVANAANSLTFMDKYLNPTPSQVRDRPFYSARESMRNAGNNYPSRLDKNFWKYNAMNGAPEDIPQDRWSGIDVYRRKVFDWYKANNNTVKEKIISLEKEYIGIYRELQKREDRPQEYNHEITSLLLTRGQRLQEVLKSFILNIFKICEAVRTIQYYNTSDRLSAPQGHSSTEYYLEEALKISNRPWRTWKEAMSGVRCRFGTLFTIGRGGSTKKRKRKPRKDRLKKKDTKRNKKRKKKRKKKRGSSGKKSSA